MDFDDDRERLKEEIKDLTRALPSMVLAEAKASIGLVMDILKNRIVPDFDYKSKFLNESFKGGHAGYGVRKETFVPIKSGKNTKLHLAEIRGDATVSNFLGGKYVSKSVESE